jgi:hypothetical protein
MPDASLLCFRIAGVSTIGLGSDELATGKRLVEDLALNEEVVVMRRPESDDGTSSGAITINHRTLAIELLLAGVATFDRSDQAVFVDSCI